MDNLGNQWNCYLCLNWLLLLLLLLSWLLLLNWLLLLLLNMRLNFNLNLLYSLNNNNFSNCSCLLNSLLMSLNLLLFFSSFLFPLLMTDDLWGFVTFHILSLLADINLTRLLQVLEISWCVNIYLNHTLIFSFNLYLCLYFLNDLGFDLFNISDNNRWSLWKCLLNLLLCMVLRFLLLHFSLWLLALFNFNL